MCFMLDRVRRRGLGAWPRRTLTTALVATRWSASPVTRCPSNSRRSPWSTPGRNAVSSRNIQAVQQAGRAPPGRSGWLIAERGFEPTGATMQEPSPPVSRSLSATDDPTEGPARAVAPRGQATAAQPTGLGDYVRGGRHYGDDTTCRIRLTPSTSAARSVSLADGNPDRRHLDHVHRHLGRPRRGPIAERPGHRSVPASSEQIDGSGHHHGVPYRCLRPQPNPVAAPIGTEPGAAEASELTLPTRDLP